MRLHHYDVLVIGGGPAGLTAAIAAAEQGCTSVALVERKKRWGWPIQCAEMVPKLITQTVPLEREAIVQAVTGFQFHLNGQAIGFLRAPGYVLDRSRLEGALADRAARLGIVLWQPANVLAIAGGGALVSQRGNHHELEASILVAADGPHSLVRRVFVEQPMEFAYAIQHVLPLAQPSEVADVFLAREYHTGYGWCFPRGREANVGVALPFEQRGRLSAALDGLVQLLLRSGKLAGARPTRRTAGLVPVGGPIAQTAIGSMVLVGSAAGQVHPLSGAGILTACACGQLAGKAAARAVAQRCLSPLGEYDHCWRDLYGSYFARGLESRKRLLDAPADKFIEAVQAVWHLRPRS